MASCLGTFMAVVAFLYPIVEFFTPVTLTFVVLWLILRPTHVRPQVDDAVLAQFRLLTDAVPNATTSTTTLDYDIAIDLSFHNPKRNLAIRYLDLTAVASYGGVRLGPTVNVLPVFPQRPKASNVVHAVFQGSSSALSPSAAEVFGRDLHVAGSGFNVTVTVTSTFMYKIPLLNPVYYYKYTCELSFPAVQHGGKPASAVLSRGAACSVIR